MKVEWFKAVGKPSVYFAFEFPKCPLCGQGWIRINTHLQLECMSCQQIYRKCLDSDIVVEQHIIGKNGEMIVCGPLPVENTVSPPDSDGVARSAGVVPKKRRIATNG